VNLKLVLSTVITSFICLEILIELHLHIVLSDIYNRVLIVLLVELYQFEIRFYKKDEFYKKNEFYSSVGKSSILDIQDFQASSQYISMIISTNLIDNLLKILSSQSLRQMR
jgi:hypothetical protein